MSLQTERELIRVANRGSNVQSVHENRIYSVKMHCGDKYPDEPPTIQFLSQVNLPCVDSRNGMVDPSMLPCLAQWKRENTMETVLIELRRCVSVIQLLEVYRKDVGCAKLRDYLTDRETGTWLRPETRRFPSLPRAQPTHSILRARKVKAMGWMSPWESNQRWLVLEVACFLRGVLILSGSSVQISVN